MIGCPVISQSLQAVSKTSIVFVIVTLTAWASAAAETYDGFTEPFESIKVAASEVGTIETVHVKQGERVNKGDILVTLDLRVLEAARNIANAKANGKARLQAAEIELAIKLKRWDKLTLLKEQGAGSSEEVDRAKADVRIAESQVAATREDIELAVLEMARINAQIERNRIRSPITGYVTKLQKKPGEFVSQNEPDVATVVNIDQLRARFHVSTIVAHRLAHSSRVTVSIPAFTANSSPKQVTANVQFVSPITDPDSGTVHIEVVFANPKRTIRSGVRCTLHPEKLPIPLAQRPNRSTRIN
ncbi:efflux RND transporter periplasmic adaptor subunit [bacterium]|nr:efflux RND transporter periplasmic adaptor subunit [bacterium]